MAREATYHRQEKNYLVENLDNRLVVFDRRNGDTHSLRGLEAYLFDIARSSPMSVSELEKAVLEDLPLDFEGNLQELIQRTLTQLEGLSLVERSIT